MKAIAVVGLADTAVNRKQHKALSTTEFASKLKKCGDLSEIQINHDRHAFAKAGVAVWHL